MSVDKNGSVLYHRSLLSQAYNNDKSINRRKISTPVEVKTEENTEKEEPFKLNHQQREKIADTVEMMARILLPTTYLIFNLFYWITYLNDGGVD